MQYFLPDPTTGKSRLALTLMIFCGGPIWKMFSESPSPIIAKHFFISKLFTLRNNLFFALIMPSNFVQRNESWSWLGWKLSQLSKGLTLGNHVEHFLPRLLRNPLKGKINLYMAVFWISVRWARSLSLQTRLMFFANFKFSIYFHYYSHSSVKFHNSQLSFNDCCFLGSFVGWAVWETSRLD